ncbi:MAG: hypothetical protein PHW69_06200 [Elusimicrobiaceae bacterium]|nr:hypothetical protein [Elusimicrobiaceae bacterium]
MKRHLIEFFSTRFGAFALACVALVLITALWVNLFHKNPVPETARELYNPAKLLRDTPFMYYNAGKSYMRMHKYRLAADSFAAAAEMAMYLPDAYDGQARALYMRCDLQEYVRVMKQLDTLSKFDPQVAQNTAKLKKEVKKLSARCLNR